VKSGHADGARGTVKYATPLFYSIAAPSKPKLVSASGHKFKATWTAKAHTTRYLVQYRATGAWKSLGYVTKASYSSKALTKGKTYAVRVTPYDGTHAGTPSASSSIKIK
jgi:hypothetical protein